MGIGLAGLAAGIGAGLQGYVKGVQMRSDLNDAEQRRALAKEQNEREKERMAFERERVNAEKERLGFERRRSEQEGVRFEEERRRLEAQKRFADEIAALNEDVKNGRNGFERFGYAAPAAGAIQAPGAERKPDNPFMAAGDGLYRNQRGVDELLAQRRAEAAERLYSVVSPEKMGTAREEAFKFLDQNVERKFKTALAAAAVGMPNSISGLAKVYEYYNDGKAIDPSSGQWDEKNKTWKGVVVFDKENPEKRATRDFSQTMLLGLAKQDPAALILFNTDQAWKEREMVAKERAVKADETRAGAAVTSAGAEVTKASAAASNAETAKGRLTLEREKMEQDATGFQQRAMVEAIGRQFPLAGKELKPEDMLGLSPQQKADRMQKKEAEERMYNKTMDLAALNPKVDVRTLASVARAGKVNAQQEGDRVFTMVGGRKIYLQ